MPHLALDLLGACEIHRDGESITGALSAKSRALLAYLAVEADQPHSRDAVAELLWPDHPAHVARNSLRQALATLRHALGDRTATPPWLLISRDTLRFNLASMHTLDVAAFTVLRAACVAHPHPVIARCAPCMRRLQLAATLYRGDFLHQFTVNESNAFEEWAALHRERLRHQVLNCLEHLVIYHAGRGAYAQAREYAQRQLELDPWHEEAHRQMMRLLTFEGQRRAALEHYEQCRRILAADLGGEPSEETTTLAVQIRAGTLTAPIPPVARHVLLPTTLTSFIGRAAEQAALAQRLEDPACRLLTLTGPGGVGKTRLALQVAADLKDDFADGVDFVPLATLSDAALVIPTIAQALGVRETSGETLQETLTSRLANQQRLLVLDNFEQVLTAALDIAQLLAAPHLKVLVTSPTVLHLSGEHQYAVPHLTIPDPNKLPGLVMLAQYEAVALFVQRARAVNANFLLTDGNAQAVVEICIRLDGLPLAIELAAARSGIFAPQALLTRLANRLRFLTQGVRDLPARQQTIRNTIAWSYDLLEEHHRQLFRRLAVFVGGSTLEAVEAVCAADYEGDILDGITALVEQNLVRQMEGPDGEPRFRCLETIREYALEQLQISGETEAVCRMHTDHFVMLTKRAEAALLSRDRAQWLAKLGTEHDNLRAALAWSTNKTDRIETALRLAGALWQFWEASGYLSDGRSWLDMVLARSITSQERYFEPLRAHVLHGAGVLAGLQGDYLQATSLTTEALALYRGLDDVQGTAFSLNSLGSLALYQGDYQQAQMYQEESLALRRTLGSTWSIAWSVFELGHLARYQGDYTRAKALCSEALSLFQNLGEKDGAARALNSLGDAAIDQGDYTQAQTCYEESMVFHRGLGNSSGISVACFNLGRVAHRKSDYLLAATLYEESLARFRDLGDKRHIGYALRGLGDLARLQGDHGRAEALTQESLVLFRALGNKHLIARVLISLGHLALQTADVTRAAGLFAESLSIGHSLGVQHTITASLAGLDSVAASR